MHCMFIDNIIEYLFKLCVLFLGYLSIVLLHFCDMLYYIMYYLCNPFTYNISILSVHKL